MLFFEDICGRSVPRSSKSLLF